MVENERICTEWHIPCEYLEASSTCQSVGIYVHIESVLYEALLDGSFGGISVNAGTENAV
jgi:hypothetical protein